MNAHTGTDETVYELDLPDAVAGAADEVAFDWFRDVADGLLFEEKEVQARRGSSTPRSATAAAPGCASTRSSRSS